jgi:hypothetical protein
MISSLTSKVGLPEGPAVFLASVEVEVGELLRAMVHTERSRA